MTNISITDALHQYFTQPAIKTAVDSLVEKLDGKHVLDLSWDEARDYNQALLMASQVRADFVDMLFWIWGETFDRAGVKKLGKQSFTAESYSPAEMWEDKNLFSYFYRDGTLDEGRNDELGVVLENKNIFLWVARVNENDEYIALESVENADGWTKEYSTDDECNFMRSEKISLEKLLSDPETAIETLRVNAKNMIAALLKD